MITGGGILVRRPPAFSSDGQKLLVCTGNTVSVYSVATGLLTYIPRLVVVSCSGKFVGMADKRKIHVWKTPLDEIQNAKEIKKIRLHHTKELCTLAFHPSDTIVAGGDVTGRVLIWRGVGQQTFSSANVLENGERLPHPIERPGVRGTDDAVSCTVWHWHSSEVKFLSFSSDGAYLYSGGKEGVLVIWQLETGKRQYLPRLGGPLLFLANSPEPSLFSISCADNKILLVSIATMTIEKSIDGIKPPFSLPENLQGLWNNGPAADPKAGILVLPAQNYSVQFYDMFYDRPVSEKAMLCAGFSADGSLLAVGAGDLITLWNPDTNSLVSVIGESLYSPSEHLVTVSKGSKPRLTVWNLTTLCVWWSYHMTVEAIASDPNRSNFAILAPFPVRVSDKLKSEEDAIILLFSVEDPIPVAAWAVRKGMGATLKFIQPTLILHEEDDIDKGQIRENRLVFLNRDHEYVVFNPYSSDGDEANMVPHLRFSSVKDQIPSGYEAMFGKIPVLDMQVGKSAPEIEN